MDNAGTNPSRVLQYSIDARPEPRSSLFDCGHNFRIGAAEKGMEDSIIKTRGDGKIKKIGLFHFISLPYVTTTVTLYQSTSQHSRVCIVHLALTLSNPGLPIRVFSSINL